MASNLLLTLFVLLLYTVLLSQGRGSSHETFTLRDLTSTIVNVTIAGNAAMITRHLHVPLSSLPQQPQDELYLNIVSSLTSSTIDNSIRIVGTGPCSIVSHELRDRAVDRKDSIQYQQRNTQIQELKMDVEAKAMLIDNELSRLRAREKYLYVFIEASLSSKQEAPLPSSIAAVGDDAIVRISKAKSLLEYLDSELIAVHSRLSLAQRAQTQIIKCMETINDVVADLSTRGRWHFPKLDCSTTNGDSTSNSVPTATTSTLPFCVLHLSTSNDEQELSSERVVEKFLNIRIKLGRSRQNDLHFYISYMSAPAQWGSVYDIQVVEDAIGSDRRRKNHKLVVDYFASVSQHTGEPWEGVNLALSTLSTSPIQPYPMPHEKAVFFQEAQGYAFDPAADATFEKSSQPHTATMMGGRMRRGSNMKQFKSAGVNSLAMHSAVSAPVVEGEEVPLDAEDSLETPPPDMMVTSAMTSSPSMGDLAAAYTFIIPDNVYVKSSGGDANNRQRSKQRLLIDKLELKVDVFTYCVPSVDSRGYLRTYGQYASTQPYSLVGSQAVRVFLGSTFSGTTNIDTIQPGQELNINLGRDNNFIISGRHIVPHNQGKEQEQGWFFSDKQKYHVKQEEFVFNAKSNHNSSHLILIAENLPKSTDKDITIELLNPDKNVLNAISMEKAGDHEHCVFYILSDMYNPTSATSKVFHCVVSNDIIWAQWTSRGGALSSSLKYKLIWPDKKEIFVS